MDLIELQWQVSIRGIFQIQMHQQNNNACQAKNTGTQMFHNLTHSEPTLQ